jgi:hypothetical protein
MLKLKEPHFAAQGPNWSGLLKYGCICTALKPKLASGGVRALLSRAEIATTRLVAGPRVHVQIWAPPLPPGLEEVLPGRRF